MVTNKLIIRSIDMNKKPHTTGKVYLVGAGPSDIALLTIKGRQVLEQAQAVLYDALIGAGILNLIPREAEKINVGKRAGHPSMKQEEISRLLADKALEGKTVVRLKGGDPFLFGRGGEELELLVQYQIPYEIVPGVTSAVAVPAYNGIPLTHRDAASSVHIITGHKKQGAPLAVDFKALLQAGGTYVFLMGVSAMHEILQGFLDAGMAPDTPAAVLQEGTSARQRNVISTAAELEAEAERQEIGTPAVIVIGDVAALGNRFAWYEKLPLSHSRILVTRPSSSSKKLADTLRSLGAEVLEQPAIRTQIRDCAQQLKEILLKIADYRYMVFTSPAGVDYFFALLEKLKLDIRCIGGVSLAVIGSATGEALKKRGLLPELMPEQYNSIALGKLLNESMQEGGQVLLLRSAMGNPRLAEEIQRGKQIKVTDLAIYDTIYETEDFCGIKELPAAGQLDMVMFTSAATVRGFAQTVQGVDLKKIHAVCIGQMTAAQAAAYGMQITVAEKETIESMIEAAVSFHASRLG